MSSADLLVPGTEAPGAFHDPVAWDVAERVAVRLAKREPLAESYHYDSLVPDFAELTALAEELVAAETGLRSSRGPARAQVIDRPGWVQVNISSFRRLLRPLTERLGPRMGTGMAASMGRTVAGAEVGALLGWMSTRVLGQYDFLVEEGAEAEAATGEVGDVVYYVGPNILSLEKRFGFPPREFRLWLALHEVTHRMQFTGVDWMRGYFLDLVAEGLGEFDPDPKRFVDSLRRTVEQVRAGDRPLDDGGLMALFATPGQRASFAKIQALMSILEGHGELVMNRAAQDLIPSAGRFRHVLHRRRQAKGVVGMVQRMVGMEAKLRQYAQGERFLAAIDAARPGSIDELWQGPQCLPTQAEIAEHHLWLDRMAPDPGEDGDLGAGGRTEADSSQAPFPGTEVGE